MKKIDWKTEIADILDLRSQGLSNTEIAKIYKVAPETIVRGVVPFQHGYEQGLKSNHDIELESLNKKHLRVLLNQKKVTMIKRELNQGLTTHARFEMIISKIKKPINPIKNIKIKKGDKQNFVPYYLISDTHWVNEELSNPKGKLSAFILKGILNDIKKLNVNEINLIHLGDFIEGRIHNSQDWDSGAATIIDQTTEIAHFMIEIIENIIKQGNVKVNYYQVANGNHDELALSGKGKNRDTRENVSYLIGSMIEKYFRNNKTNFKIQVDEKIYIKDKLTKEVLYFTHLYTRSANPKNVPQLIANINYQRDNNKHFHYSFSGHNHMLYTLDFKGQKYKAYGVPAAKIVQNTFEKTNNLYSTQGFCRFLKQNKNEIDWKYWEI